MTPLHGVLPVLHTPYHEDWTIDYDTLGEEVEFAFAQGAANPPTRIMSRPQSIPAPSGAAA